MEAGSGHEESSLAILTLDALGLYSFQVTPGLSMSMRIQPICKVYIHTLARGAYCTTNASLAGAVVANTIGCFTNM
jgi:hypothetical protein